MEKNIFMVWVGDNIPEYAKNGFNAFQNMNPDASCELIHCTYDTLGDWEKRLKDYKADGCLDFDKCVESDDPWHRCMLSNLIRYWAVQTNGGIYIDCDMFPIRPFDELFELDRPFRITKIKPPKKFVTDDINFFGCPKGENAQNKPVLLFPIKLYDFNDQEYINLRNKFFSCSIKIGEHYNDPEMCYVDHYDSNTYGRNKNNPELNTDNA